MRSWTKSWLKWLKCTKWSDKFKELVGEYEKEQMKKDLAVQEAVTLMADSAKEA